MSEKNFPKELKYSNDYSWIKLNQDVATIGVLEASAKKVGEFVFVQLPEKNKKIKKGEKYISLEAVKWSGHLSSPFSGEIIEVNEDLFDEPSKINENPYQEWIMKIKLDKKEEVDELMDSQEAIKFYEKKIE
jgi:glycine cleavage system H protein